MPLTHPDKSAIRHLGSPPHVDGFVTAGEAVQGVVEKLAEGLMTEPAAFWFVWTKTGHVPRFAHDSFEAAQAEARRLALLRPGKKFIVLQAIEKVVAAPAEERAA